MEGLQVRLHEWRQRNFPGATAEDQLLGVVEEVGELAHAMLKRKQGIRGTDEEHEDAEKDAIGDILVYLAGLCSCRRYHMRHIYETIAQEVMQRDWLTYPHDGLTR